MSIFINHSLYVSYSYILNIELRCYTHKPQQYVLIIANEEY
jgi:hypothetical protein